MTMKTYRGVVVQRCYITVEVEVEEGTSLDHVAHLMQEKADPSKGAHESEAMDIEEVTPEPRPVPTYSELAEQAGATHIELPSGECMWVMTHAQLCAVCNNVGAQDENTD